MSHKSTINQLYVYINGQSLGVLKRRTYGELEFIYDSSWLMRDDAWPISLSMPLTEIPYKGDVVNHYFDNLLPDSELIRERIQARFGTNSKKCFDLLSHIGGDCVGALQLLTQAEGIYTEEINADPIDDQSIARLLKGYQTAPLGMARHSDFRISIAGAQEKTALLRYQDKWCLPKGTTPTSHIIKLPIGKIAHAGMDLSESVENEWLCLQILAAYGLPVSQVEMTHFDDMKTLVVERFDRQWSHHGKTLLRLPQEDMCQVLGIASGLKYESDGGPGISEIMGVLRGAQDPIADRERFMKSVFLYWILGAIDGHAKNFSISIEAKGRYKLTPAYDVMSAYPLAAKRQLEYKDMKMAMSLKGKNRHYHWHNILPRHWLAMANQCHFPEATMQQIIDEVYDTMDAVIEKVSTQLPQSFPTHIAEPIFSAMKKMKSKFQQ